MSNSTQPFPLSPKLPRSPVGSTAKDMLVLLNQANNPDYVPSNKANDPNLFTFPKQQKVTPPCANNWASLFTCKPSIANQYISKNFKPGFGKILIPPCEVVDNGKAFWKTHLVLFR